MWVGSRCRTGISYPFTLVHGTLWSQDTWTAFDARVACRQLGYPYGIARPAGTYGKAPPDQSVWLGYLACNGSESSISQCSGVVVVNDVAYGSGAIRTYNASATSPASCNAHDNDLDITWVTQMALCLHMLHVQPSWLFGQPLLVRIVRRGACW